MLRKFSVLLTAGALSATLGTSALASDLMDADNPANNKWFHDLGTASSGPLKNTIKGQHLGGAASAQSVDRQIELRPGTKYVNVTRGETVLIKVGGKAFAWKFDTLGTPVFNLQEIAPKDINVQGVQVYVGQNPYDLG